MQLSVFICVHLWLTSLCVAQDAPPFEAKTFTSGGDTLPYRIFVPKSYAKERSRKFPLILYLHNALGRSTDNLKQITEVNAPGPSLFSSDKVQAEHPSIIVAPQCPTGQSWASTNPVRILPAGFLAVELLDSLMKQLRVDTNRVYVVGQSIGGSGVWALLADHPEKFAAAVPLAAFGDTASIDRLAAIPVWVFQGEKDPTVPVARVRKMVAALKEAGGSPKYTEYPGALHDIWSKAFAEPQLPEWLFSQKKR
jgi:predicted peptidase